MGNNHATSDPATAAEAFFAAFRSPLRQHNSRRKPTTTQAPVPDTDIPIPYTLTEPTARTPESVPDELVARALQALQEIDAYNLDVPIEQAVRTVLAASLPLHSHPCVCRCGHRAPDCPAATDG